MRVFILPTLLIMLLSACGGEPRESDAASADPLLVALRCQSLSDNPDEPRFAIYAFVGEFKMKVAEINGCDSISPQDYEQYRIPPDALSAAGGWWAGAGDYFYARRDGRSVGFYQGQIDESQEGNDPGYRLVASFEEGKFHFRSK